MTSVAKTVQLNESLEKLFLDVAKTISERLQAANKPEVLRTRKYAKAMKRQGKAKLNQVNILWPSESTYEGFASIWPDADRVSIDALNECAKKLVATGKVQEFLTGEATDYIPVIEPYNPRGVIPFENNEPEWVAFHIIRPLLFRRLRKLDRVSDADPKDARMFAEEVIEMALGETVTYQATIYMSHLDSGLPGDVEIVHEETSLFFESAEDREHFTGGYIMPEQCVLTTLIHIRKDEDPISVRQQINRLLLAFQLNSFDASLIEDPHLESVPNLGVILDDIVENIPKQWYFRSENPDIDAKGLAQVLATRKQLEPFNLEEPNSRESLALHRFVFGMSRDNAADSLLDFIITLESLFLPEDDKGREELSYRFRVHGAFYLGSTAEERKKLSAELRRLYELRSRLIHGGKKYPPKEQVEHGAASAYDLARRSLLRALDSDFPTTESLSDLVLSGG